MINFDGVGETTADLKGAASGTVTLDSGLVLDYTTTGVTGTTWSLVENEGFVWAGLTAATEATVYMQLKRAVEAAGWTWDPIGPWFVVLHWYDITYPTEAGNVCGGRYEISQGTTAARVEGHVFMTGAPPSAATRRLIVQDETGADTGSPDTHTGPPTEFWTSYEIAAGTCTVRYHTSEPTEPDTAAPIWDASFPAYTAPRIDISSTALAPTTCGLRIGCDNVASAGALTQKLTFKVYGRGVAS
jgi:hypothetical protein